MAEFLSTRGISYKLEEIIKSATKELIIITPYLKFSIPIYEQLKAVSKVVKLCFIYGKTDLQFNQDKLIKDLNCDILYKENLHAKCYLNEQSALICSMNLHAYSEVNNYEMGVLLDAIADKKAYAECRTEIDLISLNAKQIRLLKREEAKEEEVIKYDRTGFVPTWIKCLKTICSGFKFEEIDNGIVFLDFPQKNINLTTNYGIASFEIQLPLNKCRTIKDSINAVNGIIAPDNYRLFWNNPYNKIQLYWGRERNFKFVEEEIEYCKKGLLKIIEDISKCKFE